MIERAKDVGDLAKAVLTTERYYLGDRDSKPSYQAGRDRPRGPRRCAPEHSRQTAWLPMPRR